MMLKIVVNDPTIKNISKVRGARPIMSNAHTRCNNIPAIVAAAAAPTL
ncbi:MAG TPA: hypothetical protein VFJ51_08930 [Nitrososphaeraceae archaeon]|nr:hypothetical protein [Nitrososphaeraceae archaeon]